jgi:integrase
MATFSLAAQFRLVRAALLLIGDTGLRREEAALATRDKLKPISDNAVLWELDVLGKRNRWRTVFPSQRAISAISAHWQDRGQDFSFGLTATPLLSPLVAPSTKSSNFKHRKKSGEMADNGFSPDGLYQVIKTAFERIADDSTLNLTLDERNHLRRSTTHALRHTFGTQAVAGDVPLDVVQKVLGHASLQTTTIYVQAEKRRSIGELDKFFRHLE